MRLPRPVPPSSAEAVAGAGVAAGLVGFTAFGYATSATSTTAYLVTVLAEAAFALWLLIRGLNAEKWHEAAVAR